MRRKRYFRDRYAAKRQLLIDKLGGKCAVCSSTRGLEFDHIDPATKSFGISESWALSLACLEEELKKCQLLCEDHHKEKTARNGEGANGAARHGTPHMYRKFKCRCDECRAAASAYKKEWRAERAAAGLRVS